MADFDFSTLIYLLIVIVLSIVGGRKKKKRPFTPFENGGEKESVSSNSIFEELTRQFQTEPALPDDEFGDYKNEFIEEPEIVEGNLDSTPSKTNEYNNDFLMMRAERDDLNRVILEPILIQRKGKKKINFDIKKAIIYSEILNKKAF